VLQFEVLQGLANKQIATSWEISENTVKFQSVSSLYAKLGVTSRTEVVRSGAGGAGSTPENKKRVDPESPAFYFSVSL